MDKLSGSSSGVEHQLPKLRVAGSNPVSRSRAIDDFGGKCSFGSRFFSAPVAQLDRATDFGSVSWGFDSSQARPKLQGTGYINSEIFLGQEKQ